MPVDPRAVGDARPGSRGSPGPRGSFFLPARGPGPSDSESGPAAVYTARRNGGRRPCSLSSAVREPHWTVVEAASTILGMRSANYDVIIACGGSAGVAAAVGAARTGARALLVESGPCLGGAATLRTVPTYCGLWTQAENPERAVVGVAEEVLAGLRRMGGVEGPLRSPSGYVIVVIDPESTKLAQCAHRRGRAGRGRLPGPVGRGAARGATGGR